MVHTFRFNYFYINSWTISAAYTAPASGIFIIETNFTYVNKGYVSDKLGIHESKEVRGELKLALFRPPQLIE